LDGALGTTLGLILGAVVSSTNDEPEVETAEEVNSDLGEVCGKHLQETDPDYWNNDLTDEQRAGYNENRNQQWQNYLLKENDDNP
jgi:hypothetical protein